MDVLEAALTFAAAGWAVFPVRGKLPALDHAPHWSQDSTTNPQQIAAWYAGSQGLGIGVDLAKSGLVVIDGDQLAHLHFQDQLHGWAYQGNPARQSWLYRVNGHPIPQARHPWGDVKSAGGYVVLPPSPHDVGGTYQWLHIEGEQPPSLPPNIETLIAPTQPTDPPGPEWDGQPATPWQLEQATLKLRTQAERVAAEAGGNRNNALNQAALILGHYAPHYLASKAITDALTWASDQCGLIRDDGPAQCQATIRSGMRAGMKEPQQLNPPTLLNVDTPGINLDDLDHRTRELVLEQLRRDHATRIVTDIRAAQNPPPPVDLGTLQQILDRPPEPPPRIEGLLPANGRLLLAATRKTGKTTWLLNLTRSLLTGEPFLGTLDTQPIAGTVALLNYEVSAAQIARWAQETRIPPNRLLLINMRGRRNLLATDQGRAELVEHLQTHNAETLIVDPFGRAYTGESQNDAGEVSKWLITLDQTATDAECTELILATHAGWNGEHTRGSSALEDWPDCITWLTRDPETGQRYMRAEGRDVLLEEDLLDFNHLGRRLRLTNTGTRQEAANTRRLDELVAALVDVVAKNPGIGVRAIARIWKEQGFSHSKDDEKKASREAENRGLVTIRTGKNNAKEHHLTQVTPGDPGVTPRGDPSDPLYKEGHLVGHSTTTTHGVTCRACGLPMTEDFYGDGLHPTCEQP